MSEQSPGRTAIVPTLARVSLATLLTILAHACGYSAEGVAFAGAAGQILGVLGYDNLARRGEAYVSTFRRLLHESNEGDFENQVREQAKDPTFRNTIFHAFRSLRDALDDCVAPALAVLTKDYTIPVVRPIDAFFRDFGDVLRNLSAAEYRDLIGLVEDLAKLATDATTIDGHYSIYSKREGDILAQYHPPPKIIDQARVQIGAGSLVTMRCHRSVIELLMRHGLFQTYNGPRAKRTEVYAIASADGGQLKGMFSIISRAIESPKSGK